MAVGSVTQNFRASSYVFNTYLDSAVNNMTVAKTSGAPDPVSPGDTIPYTVTVSNPGSATLTGLGIFDTLPRGVTYAAGSGSSPVRPPGRTSTRIGVLSPTTTRVDPPTGSTTPWVETDGYGNGATGPTGGFVWVTAAQLQFRALPSTVADDFASGTYAGEHGRPAG